MDQKTEAVGLLRSLVQSLSTRLVGVNGLERRELIAAAHSTIVAAAFFEVFEERAGKKRLKQWAITAEERRGLVPGADSPPDPSVEWLLTTEIPMPSPARGFYENLPHVEGFLSGLTTRTHKFVNGLADSRFDVGPKEVSARALDRYQSHYLALAAQVPEFLIWAMLGEHAATRSDNESVRAALAGQGDALARVEALLGLVAGHVVRGDQPAVLQRANQSVLTSPVVSNDAERYGADVTFPDIGDVFVNPRYRIAEASWARPADEHWWSDLPVRDDLDVMIAGYLMSADATRVPMLLLGHPGAGKSLLTKVLAARLPAADYTVVRVPLRNVGANAPIIDQVQQALDLSTNRRIRWPELTEQSGDTVRVVLLDGLDELLQAAQHDRSGYLQQVVEFQRIEAEQKRPVVFVVTSRTVVADRVDIPEGVAVVKLEEFDEPQIAQWLRAWRAANATAITAGRVRELTMAEALHQPDLVSQPLLLLVLALYAADPASPKLDHGTSTSVLYERIFDNFARREVSKRAVEPLSREELERGVRDQLRRLSVAALAMFNRGVQHLSEADLQVDLEALEVVPPGSRGDRHGKRLLGEFFFVHTAEANLIGNTERAYEFLHATFGEYLVARFVVNVLLDVAASAYGGSREPREPEDERLFAVLSHQVLASRISIVAFAVEILSRSAENECEDAHKVLIALLGSYRGRRDSQHYASYRPAPVDHVRQLASYSANLVTLAAAFEGPVDASHVHRSTVDLWRSGLDQDSLAALATWLGSSPDGRVVLHRGEYMSHDGEGKTDFALAELAGERSRAGRIQYGMAVYDRVTFSGGSWIDSMMSWIIPVQAGVDVTGRFYPPDPGTPDEDVIMVLDAVLHLIGRNSHRIINSVVHRVLVHLLQRLELVHRVDPRGLLIFAYSRPDDFMEFPQLHEALFYSSVRDEAVVVLALAQERLGGGRSTRARWGEVYQRILGEPLPPVDVDSAKVDRVVRVLTNVLRPWHVD